LAWSQRKFHLRFTRKNGIVPDSLKQFPIQIPIKSIVVTSTTHIPALEMLGVEIRSLASQYRLYFRKNPKTHDAGKIRSWEKRNLNTEVLIDMQPDLIVGFGLNNNPLWIFYKSGLK
jgi:iron complex transport system substrate-binding protein